MSVSLKSISNDFVTISLNQVWDFWTVTLSSEDEQTTEEFDNYWMAAFRYEELMHQEIL